LIRSLAKKQIIGTSELINRNKHTVLNVLSHFRLEIIPTAKYITAQLVHFKNGPVIEASTKEWSIKRHLFRTSDQAAYINLAKIFSQRCLEAGIIEMTAMPKTGLKIEKFFEILKENGLSLQEPPQIDPKKSKKISKYVGRKMTPVDWKEIVEHH
jgi:ribosomal protein L18